MAHNALIRGGTSSGAWTSVVPTVGDWETFDQRQFESINGDLGGTWAPSAVITIGNAGLAITSSFSVASGGLTDFNSGTVTITDTGFVTGGGSPADFQGPVTITADAIITGSGNKFTFDTSADRPEFKNGLRVTAGTTIFDDLTDFEDSVTFNGGIVAVGTTANFGAATSIVSGSFSISGGVSVGVSSPIVMNSGGGVLARFLAGPDADTSILANTYDRVRVGPLTANRTYILKDAPNGTEIIINMATAATSGANQCRVYDDHGIQLVVLLYQTSGSAQSAHLIVRSGNWELFDFDTYP